MSSRIRRPSRWRCSSAGCKCTIPIRRSVVQIFAPASEYGVAGVEELQQQVAALLSFKKLPKAVFDAQLGFNLLARYGEEAPAPLERSSCASSGTWPPCWAARPWRGRADAVAAAHSGAGVSRLQLFGMGGFDADPSLEALESGLASEWIDVRGAELDPPDQCRPWPARTALRWGPSRRTEPVRRLVVLAGGRQPAAGRGERRGGGAATPMNRTATVAILLAACAAGCGYHVGGYMRT